ncbi:hypothetical protein O2K51_13800 [Apibacter raozihei]|uniref:hypothetical protein n=1 Tax=Apibacter raozihei TaxID=2500547 RepID=UPI000FE37528|nr:hypothetical protein [Apibacter raozihei]
MKKYLIKRGDTLESIASALGLSLFELKNFHNNHCELFQLIGDKLPGRLKEIYYQPKKASVNRDISQLKQGLFTLNLNPQLKTNIYQVMVSSFTGEKENTIKFKTEITWLERNKVRIYRTDLFINDEEPNLMADKLACEVVSSLYPMDLSINTSGEITDLLNDSEIQKRWNANKKDLEDNYIGETFERYISKNDQIISSSGLLFQQIKKDWFYQTFFNGLYHEYSNENAETLNCLFPVLPFIPAVEYKVNDQINLIEDENETLYCIDRKGVSCDERSLFDFENEAYFPVRVPEEESLPPALGKYRARYFLEPKYSEIESLYLECTLELAEKRKVYVTASRVKDKSTYVKEVGIINIGQIKEEKSQNRKSFLFD